MPRGAARNRPTRRAFEAVLRVAEEHGEQVVRGRIVRLVLERELVVAPRAHLLADRAIERGDDHAQPMVARVLLQHRLGVVDRDLESLRLVAHPEQRNEHLLGRIPLLESRRVVLLGAREIADLAARTRDNKLKPDELAGGTFTLTNTGSRGALFDTPIVFLPQSAILGLGAVVKKPGVVTVDGKDAISVRSYVYLALSYDHRIIDGADAARFLGAVKARLEAAEFEADLGI